MEQGVYSWASVLVFFVNRGQMIFKTNTYGSTKDK